MDGDKKTDRGRDLDILELDKSGNLQRRWLHTADDTLVMVSRVPDVEKLAG